MARATREHCTIRLNVYFNNHDSLFSQHTTYSYPTIAMRKTIKYADMEAPINSIFGRNHWNCRPNLHDSDILVQEKSRGEGTTSCACELIVQIPALYTARRVSWRGSLLDSYNRRVRSFLVSLPELK